MNVLDSAAECCKNLYLNIGAALIRAIFYLVFPMCDLLKVSHLCFCSSALPLPSATHHIFQAGFGLKEVRSANIFTSFFSSMRQ